MSSLEVVGWFVGGYWYAIDGGVEGDDDNGRWVRDGELGRLQRWRIH